MTLKFRVAGIPVPQGSMSGYVRGGHVAITDQKTKKLKPWREAIRQDALRVAGQAWQPLEGPVRVHLEFALPKPSSAPKTRRTWPVKSRSGDIDKLTRAVFDALTDAGIWRDDSQVTDLFARKDFVGRGQVSPGVVITIDQYPGGTPL